MIFNNLLTNFTCNGGERDLTIVFSAIFSTLVLTRTMLAIFQAYGTSPAKNDLFRSEQKVGAISIAHSFNTRGGRWSGPGDLCQFRFLRKRKNLICVTKDSR